MDVIQGYECLNSCIVNSFNLNNKNISPSDIFFLGDGLNITYTNIEKPVIGAYLYESNFSFLDKYHIKYVNDFSSNDKAKSLILDTLKKNNVISIKVSSTYLSYNRVFKQTLSSSHFITITGYQNNSFSIIDGFVPTMIPSIYSGNVLEDELLLSWEDKKFEYLIIENYDLIDVKNDSKKAFFKSLNNYITNDNKTGIFSVIGLLNDLKLKLMDQDFKALTLEVNYQLKIYGYLTSKFYILEKIKELASINADEYCHLIDQYNMLTFNIVKLGIVKKEDLCNQIIFKAQNLIEHEIKILNEMKDGIYE